MQLSLQLAVPLPPQDNVYNVLIMRVMSIQDALRAGADVKGGSQRAQSYTPRSAARIWPTQRHRSPSSFSSPPSSAGRYCLFGLNPLISSLLRILCFAPIHKAPCKTTVSTDTRYRMDSDLLVSRRNLRKLSTVTPPQQVRVCFYVSMGRGWDVLSGHRLGDCL